MSGVKRNGSSDLRQRQPVGQAHDLFVLDLPGARARKAIAWARSLASRSDTKRPQASASASTLATPSEPFRPGGGGAKHWLTTTGPSATPARSSIAYAVSTSSLTGVSSGRVTSTTWQRAGSESSATTSEACLLIGPTRTASSSPRGESRNETAWPAAGASTMIRSAARDSSSDFTLPSTRMSFIPGTALATTSSAPDEMSRLEIRFKPWVSR